MLDLRGIKHFSFIMDKACHVKFDLDPSYFYYKPSNDTMLSNYLQDSRDRIRAEYASLQTQPQTHLNITSRVFDECRNHDITIIFGNLGRHPLLLTYFLDFIYTSKESVGIISQWSTDTPYQIKPKNISPLDFLFIVEPYFGYSVVKPPEVKHLVVLSSHLVLNVTNSHMAKLFLSPPIEPTFGDSKVSKTFTPPVFHEGKVNQIPPKVRVHLDVSKVSSAHEAYLRLLTGREMARDRLITLALSSRDRERIQKNIEKSREKAITLGWQEDHDNYLKFFENTDKPLTILERPSISN